MTSNDPVWRRACNSSNCVEVRRNGGLIEVRDSKLGEESEIIEYSLDGWSRQVIAEIRDGGWLPEASYREDDGTVVLQRRINAKLQLRFTAAEWDAFVVGVRRGEFDDLTAEWRSAAPADVDPDSGTHSTPQPVSVELSADSGPVVSDVHLAPTTRRVCMWPDCTGAFDIVAALAGRARADGWLNVRQFSGYICPAHAVTGHLPRRSGATAACDCGWNSPIGATLGALAAFWGAHVADEIDPPVPSAPADTNQGGTHG